ncbi:alpha/beta fold hydrolase [Pseudolysobacter antarcticus]|uniref:Alpha/beta fold hydrolase n=1 Tax=Pseudolysobacter antarcticus TaxID=2511995 RepID=A0A411HHH0_9GAMM|nr:alpha/beta fold hydrolase [Pseudolysobacter antarcticus]QBB69968.1 alpha/beta fold hydrolase [Pseudolysobacter antarcticus]
MNRFLWIKNLVLAGVMAVAPCAYATGDASPNVPGKWHGSMQTASGTFALELTIQQDEHGTLSAALESVDQAPGQFIHVSRVEQEKDQLKLELDTLSASYAGHFDAKKDAWIGNWQQGPVLPLTWLRGPLPPQPAIDGIDGIWRATLTRNASELRLILRISTSTRGTRAKLDSPDMGIAGLDVTDLSRDGEHVHFRVPLAGVDFVGKLDDNTTSLSGLWRREGQPQATINFTRSAESAHTSMQRPQTPHAPFEYAVESVRFDNTAANILLASTLTLPRGAGPFPAAVLISGSGPQDRDESLSGHKPFVVLADHLTRNGIAVLRFDDRGVGESGGNFTAAADLDFASDVRAAVDFLGTRREINRNAIGLIGHSQGGIVGPIAAVNNPSIAYLVLLAAPATSMTELLLAQRRLTGVMQGQTEASLRANEPALAKIYAAMGKAPDRAAAQAEIRALLTSKLLQQLGSSETQKSALVDQLSSDWLRDLLHYDPIAILGAINIPILALNGSLDNQVPASTNLAAIRRATSNNPDVTAQQLPGLNHLFQNAHSGAIAEYAEISETFAPTALRLIGDWINARFSR